MNPYQKPSPMTREQKELLQKENDLRYLFAEKKNDPRLSDPHVLLLNVFENESTFNYQPEDEEEKKVPKLLTHHRKLDLQGSAIVSKQKFLSNFEEFTQGCLRNISWDNLFVAGGAILGCLSSNQDGYRSSDIDLFIYGIDDENAANEKLRSLYRQIVANTKGKGDVIRTNRAITILCAFPFRHIQIILRLYRSPAEVLLGFDIDSCCVGFDGTNVWCQERFRRALTKRYNLVNISRRSLTYEQRLFKYSKRGFAVAVPDLNKACVNTDLFRREVRDVQGLAKLLLLDYKQGAGKSTFSRFPKKKSAFLEDQDSDYNNDLPIPWGPEWKNEVIINMLQAKNKTNFFSSLKKNKATGDVAKYSHMFTGDASTLEPERFNVWTRSLDGKRVEKPLEWIKEVPAYQDFDNGFRRLMSGSFEPVIDDNWEKGVYLPNGQQMPPNVLSTKPFSTDESSSKDFQHLSVEHAALPFQKAPKVVSNMFPPKAQPTISLTTQPQPIDRSFGFSPPSSQIPFSRPDEKKKGKKEKMEKKPTTLHAVQPAQKPSTPLFTKTPEAKEPKVKISPPKTSSALQPSAFSQPAFPTSQPLTTTPFTTSALQPSAFSQPAFPTSQPLTTTSFSSTVPVNPVSSANLSGSSSFEHLIPDMNQFYDLDNNKLREERNKRISNTTNTSTTSAANNFSTSAGAVIFDPNSLPTYSVLHSDGSGLSLADFNGGVSPVKSEPISYQPSNSFSTFDRENINISNNNLNSFSPISSPPVTSYQPESTFNTDNYVSNSYNRATSQPASYSSSTVQSKSAPVSQDSSTTTKLLLLIALCYKKQYINSVEKAVLKDLTLSRHPLPISALEVFEIDQDLEELADTFRRICKFA